MGLERQTQYYITCDVCDDSYSVHANDRVLSIDAFREDGWKVGKKCTCPDCSQKCNKEKKE